MLRPVLKLVGLFVLVVIGSIGILVYQKQDETAQKLREVQQQKAQLEELVQRLEHETRRADVLVTDQQTVDGTLETTLLFVEYDTQGQPLPAKSFTIRGEMVHIAAQVVRFNREFLADADPLRGHSIALFTGIYGDAQAPADAARIDEPGTIPDFYRGADAQVSEFQMSLWRDFWRLFHDEAYRQSKGVDTSFGQDVWGPFKPDQLYTITLDADGGLTLRSEPLKGIYREALKQRLVG
jgi:hypothetical protein